MSTGADCCFIEEKPDKWYYRIQRWPYGECPAYDEEGPFESFEEADEHLSRHYPNPGGYRLERFEEEKSPENKSVL